MSAELMGAVWKLDLSHSHQAVMLALADHAHDDGTHCYPGVPYIAWKTGYSERNVTRILGDLEAQGLIEPQAEKIGGYGRVTEYHIHIDKGAKKSPFVKKSDRKRVTGQTEKGDRSAQNPDKPNGKGDKSETGLYVHARAVEPSENHHKEPSVKGREPEREPIPDDTTTTCLKLLKRVKGIGKNYGELAMLLAELREEFPMADPVGACRDYEFNHRTGKEKTQKHAAKLRNYFRTAANDSPKHPEHDARSGATGPAKTREYYDGWFFGEDG